MSKLSNDKSEEIRRRFSRQPVLLKAKLNAGSYEFECVAYDLSVYGVRVKLDLPLATECEVHVMVRESPAIPARVVWVNGGYVGLEFNKPADKVAKVLGSIGSSLLRDQNIPPEE